MAAYTLIPYLVWFFYVMFMFISHYSIWMQVLSRSAKFKNNNKCLHTNIQADCIQWHRLVTLAVSGQWRVF